MMGETGQAPICGDSENFTVGSGVACTREPPWSRRNPRASRLDPFPAPLLDEDRSLSDRDQSTEPSRQRLREDVNRTSSTWRASQTNEVGPRPPLQTITRHCGGRPAITSDATWAAPPRRHVEDPTPAPTAGAHRRCRWSAPAHRGRRPRRG